MARPGRHPPEVRERAVLEHRHDYPSQWAAISSIGAERGIVGRQQLWDASGNREIGLVPGAPESLLTQVRNPFRFR